MDEGLTPGAYALGTGGLVAAVSVLAWGAWSLRAALLPRLGGATARLAELILVIAIGVGCARLMGAIGRLSPRDVLIAELIAGLSMVAISRVPRFANRLPPAVSRPDDNERRSRLEWATAAAAVGVVVLQWVGHTIDAVGRGMSHADTLWYHLPFVARFLQREGFVELDGLGYESARWFSFDAHVVQALAILPYDRDWLVPMLNLGWLALALLAAWCIGEHRHAGPVALAFVAVAAGVPMMAATQPGQASTDIACGALLLAAIALLLSSELQLPELALAGAAVGLAISTKITVALPVAVLGIAVLGVVAVRRQWRAAALWSGAILATGTFWFGRNWLISGNPLPWFDVPLLFERVTVGTQEPSLLSAGEFGAATWVDVYVPGFDVALAAAWPAVLSLLVIGMALVVRGRSPTERIAGGVVAAGVAGYLATPLTAGISFGFNLRYLGPTVMLAAALVPLVLPNSVRWRVGAGLAAVALVIVGATAEHRERTPSWPSATAAAWLVLAAAAAVVVAWIRLRPHRLLILVLIGVVALAGYPAARWSIERRYVDAGIPPSDAVAEAMRDVRNARVGLFGSVETYVLFGGDLSNAVEIGTQPAATLGSPCERWRTHLSGRYDYIVVSSFGLYPDPTPDEALAGDPAVTEIVRDGDNAVFRLNGALDPAACPSG